MTLPTPKVSVGVPVYNGSTTMRPMLDALLKQTFTDFEIVISDNASTDDTAAICADYAARDARIRYIRQAENIGPERNFKFVLEQAKAPYFMWSACDDIRSLDYLEENVRFLEAHPDYVASTCPSCFKGREPTGTNLIAFSLEGSAAERMVSFFDHSWVSHGIFYAVIRTDVLRDCGIIGQRFFGFDWAVNLYLARHGNIHRTKNGLMTSGVGGASTRENPWRQYRGKLIDLVLPFNRVNRYALALSSGLSVGERLSLIKRLLKLNMMMARYQFRSEARSLYHAYLRPRFRS